MIQRAATLPSLFLDDPPAPRTLRYLERFQCIGGACEANCCRAGWSIPVDEKHHDKLKRTLSGSRAGRDAFRAAVRRDPGGGGPGRYALLVLDEQGACRLIDAEGTCSVHRRFGDSSLPDTCALYPRMLARIGDRLEMSASVSCPEVARLLLRAEDATEPVEMQPYQFPRRELSVRVDLEASPYARYTLDVRSAAIRLLSLPGYPVATRLFFTTYLGHRTAPYYHDAATRDAGAELGAELGRLDRPEVLAELSRHFDDVVIPPGLGEAVAVEVLRCRLLANDDDFRRLVGRAAASFGLSGEAVDGDALCAGYRARRDAMPAWARERLDGYLTRYAINHWMRRTHLFSHNVLAHAQELSLWIAMLKILLLGQPEAQAAFAETEDDKRVERLDAVAVEVFFRFARALEHAPQFRSAIERRLDELGLRTFAHAVALTRL